MKLFYKNQSSIILNERMSHVKISVKTFYYVQPTIFLLFAESNKSSCTGREIKEYGTKGRPNRDTFVQKRVESSSKTCINCI